MSTTQEHSTRNLCDKIRKSYVVVARLLTTLSMRYLSFVLCGNGCKPGAIQSRRPLLSRDCTVLGARDKVDCMDQGLVNDGLYWSLFHSNLNVNGGNILK